MSCSPFDLRDYFLQELPSPQSLQVETHVKTCDACREELHRLRATQVALFALPDEEIPQRIAFVSDKIFEPSPARRWFAAFWGNTARLGFVSAAMLSAALIYSASLRPTAPAPQVAAVTPSSTTVTAAEIDRRIHDAVIKAVADIESRYAEKSHLQVVAYQQETENVRGRLILAAEELDRATRRSNLSRQSAMVTGGEAPRGGIQ